MTEFKNVLSEFASSPLARDMLNAAVILIVAAVIASIVKRRLLALSARVSSAMLISRIAVWVIWGVGLSAALAQLGLELGVLLGAAGVLTVALGFASQTSVSNLISGVFLMGERPFLAGDVITVSGITGEVLSIDLLSIKLRTFDNLLVRIPNETVLKSPVTNITYFPIRRYDLQLSVAYGSDLALVREVLLALAVDDPECLVEPEPMIMFTGFGDSSIDLQFSVWATKDNIANLRVGLYEKIVATFAKNDIEIPFPQRVVHTASDAAGAPRVPDEPPEPPEAPDEAPKEPGEVPREADEARPDRD